MMEPRQSTTVPKVSKTKAFGIAADSAWARPNFRPRAVTIAPAPNAASDSRRLKSECMASAYNAEARNAPSESQPCRRQLAREHTTDLVGGAANSGNVPKRLAGA